MDDLDRYVAARSERDPDFKAAYEAEAALLALARGRQAHTDAAATSEAQP